MPKKPRPAYLTVKAYLEATGTTQEQLAAEIGITPAHLSNILSKSRNCSVPVLLKLSHITNVPVEAIAGRPASSEAVVK